MSKRIIAKAIESASNDLTDAVFEGIPSSEAEKFRSFIADVLGKVCDVSIQESSWTDSSTGGGWTRGAALPPDLSAMDPARKVKLLELLGIDDAAIGKMLDNQLRNKPELAEELGGFMPAAPEPPAPAALPKPPDAEPPKKPEPPPKTGPRPKRMEPMDPTDVSAPKDEFSTDRPTGSTPGAE